MTLHQPELLVQRKQTDAWINADPVMLVLQRASVSSDGMGGRTKAWTSLTNPQKCRVIPARSRSTSLTYTTPTGEVISSKDSLLVGRWDMDVQEEDRFKYNNVAYKVTFIEPDQRQYLTMCQLDLLGEDFDETV